MNIKMYDFTYSKRFIKNNNRYIDLINRIKNYEKVFYWIYRIIKPAQYI